MTALNSTIAILASLFAREKTGIAQRVETSLLEAWWQPAGPDAPVSAGWGDSHARRQQVPQACPYEAYKASDGYFVFAAWALEALL